ncbi:hypothetical protein EYR40_010656 [Pleurotus pulmonarius]|nr:hypothetical protein EYR36_002430 [Pleurotus pulmonarius]KAF4586642.1 hypothetical protein EYR40_010656 [Pleurotus pulmonarius]
MFEYLKMSIAPPSDLVWDTFCEMLRVSKLVPPQKLVFSTLLAPTVDPTLAYSNDIATLLDMSRLGELIQEQGFLQVIAYNLVFTFSVSDSPNSITSAAPATLTSDSFVHLLYSNPPRLPLLLLKGKS